MKIIDEYNNLSERKHANAELYNKIVKLLDTKPRSFKGEYSVEEVLGTLKKVTWDCCKKALREYKGERK